MDGDGLASYVPATVLDTVATDDASMTVLPYCRSWETCALFADISGYTRLCEAMSAKGPTGDEQLARHLNSYFELLVRTLSSNGGDVFKFAGDAVLALWPPSSEDLTTKTRRAAQCGLEIQSKLQQVRLSDDITLSVTVGIGSGTVSVVHVGGVFKRLEYLPVGEPLVQAFRAEHAATPPDVVMSPEAWQLVAEFFDSKPLPKSNMVALTKCLTPLRKVSVFKTVKQQTITTDQAVAHLLRSFIPSAVMPFVSQKNEKWASELRRITVLFVNLGIGDRLIRMKSKEDMMMIHTVVASVQRAVYRYEGSLNKFLMDDKGSTLVAAFGLPPLAHEDDAVRAVLSSLAICAQLHDLGIAPSIGITTGTAFCGVVGSRGRREYTVLGDTVNLSARLMQAATKAEGGVFCDMPTQYACRGRLIFQRLPSIQVKGKKDLVKVFNPYPKELASMFTNTAVSEKFRKMTRAISVDQAGEEEVRAMRLGARRRTIEMGTSLLQTKKSRRRFQSIISIFDTFFNPEDAEREFGGLTGGGVEVTAERIERGLGAGPHRRTLPPTTTIAAKLGPTIVEELPMEELEREIEEAARADDDDDDGADAANGGGGGDNGGGHADNENKTNGDGQQLQHHLRNNGTNTPRTPKQRIAVTEVDVTPQSTLNGGGSGGGVGGSKPSTPVVMVDDPKNLMNQLHNFQREGYMQQNTLRKQAEKHKAQARKSGFAGSLAVPGTNTDTTTTAATSSSSETGPASRSSLVKDAMIGDVVAEKERRSVSKKLSSASSLNLPPLFNSGNNNNNNNNDDRSVSPFEDGDENADYASVVVNDASEELYAAAPVKAVRILLPGGKGHITVTAYDVTSVQQLKKRVMDRCRTRKFVSDSATEDEYCFLFANTNIGLSDHLEMTAIPSILATHNIAGKDVVELSLVPIRVAAGNWYGSYAPSSASRSGSIISNTTGGGGGGGVATTTHSRRTSNNTTVMAQHGDDRRGGGGGDGGDDDEDDILDDEFANYSGAEDNEFEPTIVRPAVIRMFTKNGVMMSQGDNGDVIDDAVACDQALRMCVQDLLTKRLGGTVLVEGEVGVGKSYLLSNTVLAAPSRVLVCCTVANPFEMQKSLSVFGDLMLQLIDDAVEQAQQKAMDDSSGGGGGGGYQADPLTKRMTYLASTLETIVDEKNTEDESKADVSDRRAALWADIDGEVLGRSDLLVYLPVLNDLLRLEFPPAPVTRAMTPEAAAVRAMTIMLPVIEYVTRTRPVVFVIDDSLYMDEYSWRMCLKLNDLIVPHQLLLVISTRPINRSYMTAFGLLPPEYTALTRDRPATRRLELQPRPDEIIYQMACDALEVTQMPPLLAALVLQKSHGNPLVVKEFVYALEHNGLVTVDKTTRTCLLAKTIQFMDLNELISTVHVPVPMTLEAVLGSQIDRLSHEQQMILKVAAMIGDEFEFELLHTASPFSTDSPEAFAAVMYGLLDMNIIRRVSSRNRNERRAGRRSNNNNNNNVASSSKITVTPAVVDENGNTVPADQSLVSLTDYGKQKTEDEVKHEIELIVKNETPFTFAHGFMRDMLKSRLLEDQKSTLRALISKAIHSKLRVKASVMYLSPNTRRSGCLWIRRGVVTDGDQRLEERYVVLTDKALVVYRSEEEFSEDPAEREKPQYLWVLAGAKLARSDMKVNGFEHVAEVNVFRWVEYQGADRDACNFDEETFMLAHHDNGELRQWLREIQRVVIQQMSSQRRSLMQLARKTKIWHQQRTALGLSLHAISGGIGGVGGGLELKLEDHEREEIADRFWHNVVGMENNRQGGGLLMNQVLVRKRKFFLTEWKQRWMTLTPDGIFIRNEQLPRFNNKKIKSRGDRVSPSFTDAVCLSTGDCSVQPLGFDASKKVWTFQVHCDVYMKRLTASEWKGGRDYVFGVHTEGACQRWVENIDQVIQFHRATLLAAQRAKDNISHSTPNLPVAASATASAVPRSKSTPFR